MADEFPSRTLDKIVVRVPDGMRDRLANAAKANNRSMNSEIVARLETSLADDAELPKVGFELFQPIAAAVAEQTVIRMMDVWLEAFQGTGAKDTPSVEKLRDYVRGLKTRDHASSATPDPGGVIRRANERDLEAAATPEERSTIAGRRLLDLGPDQQPEKSASLKPGKNTSRRD